MKDFYPPQPQIADYSFLNPSKNFVRKSIKVLLAIVLFYIFYLFLILISFGLFGICLNVSKAIMDIRSNWITSTLGGIVFFIGILFPSFLLKFFFPIKENRNTIGVEITAKEHPRLFDFIHHLVKEVKSSYPKRVFLSADVNAAVFYNSSFWSLVFPIQKNLVIGLGLVNCINISEFKAVLAHELGHISQRTMRIGSYVYILNRAIYNRIYEYDDFDLLLYKVAEHRGILGLVAGGVRFILNSIRTLLGEAYKLISRYYIELSREMEYNADLVALSVAGNTATISALRRVSFGNEAYNQTIEHLNSLLKQKKITGNIFEKHLAMIAYMAKNKKLILNRNLPVLNDDIIEDNALKSRLYFKEWLTHPEQKEREENINNVQVLAEINDASPWLLFENPEKVQKEQTSAFYGKIKEDEENAIEFINEVFFLESIDKRKKKNSFPDVFNHFFDERYLFECDISKLDEEVLEFNIEKIFNRKNRKLIDSYYFNLDDRRILEEIANGNIKIKTFDFDGKKYNWKEAKVLIVQLNDEIDNQKE